VYTVLRVGLFFAVWLVIQLLTPLRGLWAVALALVGSGIVSLFWLSRPRSAMSSVVGGFFGRINARIESASRAEDDWQDDSDGQSNGVGDEQFSGGHERGDQFPPGGSTYDEANRPDRPQARDESD
jgi:hypothetical protein